MIILHHTLNVLIAWGKPSCIDHWVLGLPSPTFETKHQVQNFSPIHGQWLFLFNFSSFWGMKAFVYVSKKICQKIFQVKRISSSLLSIRSRILWTDQVKVITVRKYHSIFFSFLSKKMSFMYQGFVLPRVRTCAPYRYDVNSFLPPGI